MIRHVLLCHPCVAPAAARRRPVRAGFRARAGSRYLYTRFRRLRRSLACATGHTRPRRGDRRANRCPVGTRFRLSGCFAVVADASGHPIPADGSQRRCSRPASYCECAEANHLALDDAIGAYLADAPEPIGHLPATVSHTTTRSAAGLTFQYRPERLDALAGVIRRYTGASHLSTTAHELDRLAMVNSVPAPSSVSCHPPDPPRSGRARHAVFGCTPERLTKRTPLIPRSARHAGRSDTGGADTVSRLPASSRQSATTRSSISRFAAAS